MISDEMRELLSAYVDGELRDADAARVEDVSKRDPELRREIEAYRLLRRKLREWDAADNEAPVASALAARVLARARTMDAALAARAGVGLRGPLAIAAALLLSVAAGYLVARSTAPGAPSRPAPRDVIAVKPPGPLPDLALEGSALAPAEPPAPATVQRMRIDDHIPSRRAVELEEILRREDVVVAAPEPERRPTETRVSTEIKTIVSGYAPSAEPNGALVLIARPPALRPVEPLEAATGRALDPSEGRIMPKLAERGPDVLAPLGEVWVGVDGHGHARVVSASTWVRRHASTILPVVWADDVASRRTTGDVQVQEFILGPKARQRILDATAGPDAGFLAWLREAYGQRPLPAILAENAKDRERVLNKLVDALTRDRSATGFAVFDAKGNLLGTELFHDHGVMLAFAPRLLRGYLLEAGEDNIRVAAPREGGGGRDAVRDLLEGMPGRGLRIEREPLDVVFDDLLGKERKTLRAPDGVARVTFRTAAGHPVGHGLVRDETPIHLTLFGE